MSNSTEWKRVKIAEAYGWEYANFNYILHGVWQDVTTYPDYFNDLNACREMEDAIKAPHLYNEKLEMVVLGYPLCAKDSIAEFMLRRSTAAQRAEAFGLTLGLWKPGQTEP